MEYIDSDDINPKWYEKFNVSDNKRHLNFELKIPFGKMQISHYDLGQGIAYCTCKGMFCEDVKYIGRTSNNQFFIGFNTGKNLHITDISGKESKLSIGRNKLVIGSSFQRQDIIHNFTKNCFYQTSYLMFNKTTYDELITNQKQREDDITIEKMRGIKSKEYKLLYELEMVKNLNARLQEIYAESKILELSYEVAMENQENTHEPLGDSEKMRIERAYDILLSDIQNPPTIKELARKSAINECALKRGFKELYGMTIHGTLHEARMQEAKRLLLSGEVSVKEAANIVGYRSLGYFSMVFKERFKILPMRIK